MFRTSNPAMKNGAFQSAETWSGGIGSTADSRTPGFKEIRANMPRSTVMTLQGTVNKSALLIAICMVLAMVAWSVSLDDANHFTSTGWFITIGGAIGGLLIALVTIFKPKFSPVTAPIYAVAEGLFVGGISAFYADMIHPSDVETVEGVRGMLNTGLIFNAALLTFGIFGGLLAAYSFKLIRPNRLFYNMTIVGTMGVFAYGMIAMVAGFAGIDGLWSVYDPNNGGLVSIGFSLIVVGLASMNLVLDFDLANNGIKNGAPKFYEWYASFALLMTLVWLYVEVLRLLSKLQSRD